MVDEDAVMEAWFERYIENCRATNTVPSYKDFLIWLEERDIEVYDD